jgi:hypothetical protein
MPLIDEPAMRGLFVDLGPLFLHRERMEPNAFASSCYFYGPPSLAFESGAPVCLPAYLCAHTLTTGG